jgi:hypothetical protein
MPRTVRKRLQPVTWLNPEVECVTSTFMNTSPRMLKIFQKNLLLPSSGLMTIGRGGCWQLIYLSHYVAHQRWSHDWMNRKGMPRRRSHTVCTDGSEELRTRPKCKNELWTCESDSDGSGRIQKSWWSFSFEKRNTQAYFLSYLGNYQLLKKHRFSLWHLRIRLSKRYRIFACSDTPINFLLQHRHALFKLQKIYLFIVVMSSAWTSCFGIATEAFCAQIRLGIITNWELTGCYLLFQNLEVI